MPSVANTGRGSAFFVNVSGATVARLGSDGLAQSGSPAAVPVAGVVRDMGKNVVLPDMRTGVLSTKVLRKVQLSNGVNGTGVADPWDTFYIDVTGPASNWAGLNL